MCIPREQVQVELQGLKIKSDGGPAQESDFLTGPCANTIRITHKLVQNTNSPGSTLTYWLRNAEERAKQAVF